MSRQTLALRGVAIFLVVLNHAITLGLESLSGGGLAPMPAGQSTALVALLTLGLVAVPTFLALSGSYLAYALRGKTLAAGYRTVIAGLKFVVVPYFLWSIAFYVLIFFLRGDRLTIQEILKDLAVGYPFNFIPLLVAGYLIAPFLVRVCERHPWLVLAVCVAYQAFVIGVLRPGVFGVTFPGWAIYLTPPGLRLSVALWGIFLPLGVVQGLHVSSMESFVERAGWILALAVVAAYLIAVLNRLSIVAWPLADLLCPIMFVLLFPRIRREQIPVVAHFERLGRRAYGLYLTNLITLSLALAGVEAVAPRLLGAFLVLLPLLMLITVGVPYLIVAAIERLSFPGAQRWVFG